MGRCVAYFDEHNEIRMRLIPDNAHSMGHINLGGNRLEGSIVSEKPTVLLRCFRL